MQHPEGLAVGVLLVESQLGFQKLLLLGCKYIIGIESEFS
jgi:hypothetical protein